MARRRTRQQNARAGSLLVASAVSRPLLRTTDHGTPISISAKDVGAVEGDRWIEPFLEANRGGLERLELKPHVQLDRGIHVQLSPGPRVGAVPLLSPATRRVVAGVLVEPRFRWSALGNVFNAIGFAVTPSLGGGALVPGSAREVPPWILAGPVLSRIAAMLRHQRRGFVECQERRASIRGGVDWRAWVGQDVPRGQWTVFPCRFSEPAADPDLLSAVRWTLSRVEEELTAVAWAPPARTLLEWTGELQRTAGAGTHRRPGPGLCPAGQSEHLSAALEAMGWVAEERGLGGAKALDGLAWDVSVSEVWEAWVSALSSRLALQLGLVAPPFGSIRRPLRWSGDFQSMGSLAPDVQLQGADRIVWIDAKYKPHLGNLRRKGWRGVSEETREQHRADLHQALAYASLTDHARVDTVLAYPGMDRTGPTVSTVARVVAGRRQVRLVLADLPFGFSGPSQEDAVLGAWRQLLAS